ncbi:restriction endonuclease subunit M [Streptomonospora alba]|uniref:site-specific DNA-methyltransferase (adenine-specific) n=1 Tax=Streptomonospora alba TaxID=183763 RepID=A0A0C2FGT5_9ACTN|nr:class I SAM-dependent DNA methyltransferase [Streptomonospora alba]KIH98494.1 restriction endonuclease subunit M [Streptomonospora alba]
MSSEHQRLAGFLWSVADLLRGSYKQSEYGRVVLPFTVLRRLECVLEPHKAAIIEKRDELKEKGIENRERQLLSFVRPLGLSFFNESNLSLTRIVGSETDEHVIARNLRTYIGGFSTTAADIFEHYDFTNQIARLEKSGLLYQVAGKFAEVDLSPERVSNHQMGYLFEELIRRFSEISNETAGEHFTPREVINLMVKLLLSPDEADLLTPNRVFTVLDPACGTGGMLTAAEDFITEHNPNATVKLFGQEMNPESYAISRSDTLIKGEQADNIKLGNSFTDDRHAARSFSYLLANPPFGVEWKQARAEVEAEHENKGYRGRFGAGLPRINDGSLLFLQHMIHHMRTPDEGGARVAIVFNGSPLFTGGAESGESNIRRWILENDWLEGIVALPDQLFYNTGISTYFWILSNKKDPAHRGRVILLDAREEWEKMRKSLGDKRKFIPDDRIAELTKVYVNALSEAESDSRVKVFRPRDFGYRRITVERPLRLRFEVTEEALAELEANKTLAKDTDLRDKVLAALRPLAGRDPVYSRADFDATLKAAYADAGLTGIPAAVTKQVWNAVGVSDPEGELQKDKKGDVLPDTDLRDYENVPLDEDIHAYLEREVLPHVPDAWIDESKTKVGYEIPFTRHFYQYTPPRPLEEIDAELKELEGEIQCLLGEVTE